MNTGDADESSSSRNLTGLQQPGKNGNTEQRAAGASQESGRKFPTLFDKAGFAAALSEPSKGVLVDVNEAWVDLFGYTRQEALGKTTVELNINPDYSRRTNMLARLQERGSVRGIEMTLRTKSGEWRSFLTNVDVVEIDGQDYILNTIQDITERKQADEALRASEERYRVVIDSALDAIIVTDPSEAGRVLSANPAACRMFGYSQEEFIGLHRANILDTNDPHLATLLEQRSRWGQASTELTYKRKDGTQFPGELSSVLYRDENGEERAVAIIRDITERRQAEEQLERSNQKLNEILASIQDDFYVLDHDWVFVYASRSFTSKIGKEPKDFVGSNIWEMFPKHLGTIFEENLRSVMEKREVRRFEIPGKYTDAWYRMTAFPSKEGITVLGTDITERKQAEDALKESRRKYQDLIETTGDFIWEMDAQGRYTYCSPQMETLWGIQPESMIGRTPFDTMPAEAKEKTLEYFREAASSAIPFRGLTTTAFNSQGDLISIETSGVPFFDQSGGLLGYRGITRDITERKRAEDALHEQQKQLQLLNETLEQKVQEKTVEVHRLASDTIKAVQHERHRISHILHDDLQQRIYAIQMQLTLLHDALERENESARREATEIEKQLAEILAVTRHLSIDLSPPILRGEGLSHAINWLATQMRQRYGLPIELQANGAFALSDEELHVLLFNCVRELLFNVVKHAQASRAVVALQWTEGVLLIEVRDDGKGFSVNRPAQPESEEMNGENGLESSSGLTTIRHQLSLFGGRMEIQSEPGAGARVILIVPVAKAV